MKSEIEKRVPTCSNSDLSPVRLFCPSCPIHCFFLLLAFVASPQCNGMGCAVVARLKCKATKLKIAQFKMHRLRTGSSCFCIAAAAAPTLWDYLDKNYVIMCMYCGVDDRKTDRVHVPSPSLRYLCGSVWDLPAEWMDVHDSKRPPLVGWAL